MDTSVWACPVCFSGLEETTAGLRCSVEGRSFPAHGDVPFLLRPDDEFLVRDAEAYAEAWKRERFAPAPSDVPRLPYIRDAAWRQKARSLEALLRILGPAAGRSVVDAGAGTGWLAHRLAEAGFRCFAFDLSLDPQVGLGAADAHASSPFRFERAIANLTNWPFHRSSLDIAICNASLHYLSDSRPALAEAARALRGGGLFVIMNEPVHRDPASAERAARDFRERLRRKGGRGRLVESYRHFTIAGLEGDLRSMFDAVRRFDPAYGVAFAATRAAKRLRFRLEPASFPIYVATNRSGGSDAT